MKNLFPTTPFALLTYFIIVLGLPVRILIMLFGVSLRDELALLDMILWFVFSILSIIGVIGLYYCLESKFHSSFIAILGFMTAVTLVFIISILTLCCGGCNLLLAIAKFNQEKYLYAKDPNAQNCYIEEYQLPSAGAMSSEEHALEYRCYYGPFVITQQEEMMQEVRDWEYEVTKRSVLGKEVKWNSDGSITFTINDNSKTFYKR